MRLSVERGQLDQSLNTLEQELAETLSQNQHLQGQIADLERAHTQRLMELTSRHRQDLELEAERLRSAQLQSERLLDSRERAYKQRVKGLEEQVITLKEQLDQEMRQRQSHSSQTLRNGM